MTTIDNDQIERLIEDISSIKTVINRNRPVMQQVLNLARFHLLMLLTGLSIIAFSLLFFSLMQYYDSFNAIPLMLRYIIYGAIAADAVFLQILKQRTYLGSVKQIDRSLSLGWWLKELFSHRIIHILVPIIILVIFLSVYFILHDIPYFIIPMVSISFGVLGNVGAIMGIKYSLIFGYWFLITGICTIIFNSIPAPIALSITLGCGCLIMSISGYMASVPKKAG